MSVQVRSTVQGRVHNTVREQGPVHSKVQGQELVHSRVPVREQGHNKEQGREPVHSMVPVQELDNMSEEDILAGTKPLAYSKRESVADNIGFSYNRKFPPQQSSLKKPAS
ncbi:MAG: hypothetical protein AAF623_15175 [Planctomycetota bacterium]